MWNEGVECGREELSTEGGLRAEGRSSLGKGGVECGRRGEGGLSAEGGSSVAEGGA